MSHLFINESRWVIFDESYVVRMSDTWDVELYIYDLSQGVAAMMSEPLLGQFLTGSNKPEVTVI